MLSAMRRPAVRAFAGVVRTYSREGTRCPPQLSGRTSYRPILSPAGASARSASYSSSATSSRRPAACSGPNRPAAARPIRTPTFSRCATAGGDCSSSSSISGLLGVAAQAFLTGYLVRGRGAAWATTGGFLMWIGIAFQAVGVGGLAATYYVATGVDADDRWRGDRQRQRRSAPPVRPDAPRRADGRRRNSDPGGRVVAVARRTALGSAARAVHRDQLRGPGQRVVGLAVQLPMAAGAIAVAYYAWRRAAVGSSNTV